MTKAHLPIKTDCESSGVPNPPAPPEPRTYMSVGELVNYALNYEPPVPKCETCRFAQIEDPELATCRRYAPRPRVKTEDDPREDAWWPWVRLIDWCGEYESRVKEPDNLPASPPPDKRPFPIEIMTGEYEPKAPQ